MHGGGNIRVSPGPGTLPDDQLPPSLKFSLIPNHSIGSCASNLQMLSIQNAVQREADCDIHFAKECENLCQIIIGLLRIIRFYIDLK